MSGNQSASGGVVLVAAGSQSITMIAIAVGLCLMGVLMVRFGRPASRTA